MPAKIRLQRFGKKGKPYYHIVTADARAKRDGKYIERLGSYNPNTNPATVILDVDRAVYWLQCGAQPTDTARSILSYKGAMYKHHLLKGVEKGAFDEAEMERRFNAWLEEKEAKIQAKRDRLAKADDDVAAKILAAEKEINEKRAKELAAAASPLVEEVPAEEPTAEAAPVVEEAPAEEPAAEAALVVDEAPAEEPVAEAAPVVEEAPAEEPVAEAAPVVEEAPAEEPAAEAAPVVEEAPAEEPVAEAAPVEEKAPKTDAKPDDLKKIEGIGPKIAGTLNEAGIMTFAELAATTAEKIAEIIAGVRGNHVTDTWPAQAKMAAEGKWEELEKWQDELDGGKPKA